MRDHHTSPHSHATFTDIDSRVPFGVLPIEDMFQRKIDKILNNLHNVCGTADGILVVGYDKW